MPSSASAYGGATSVAGTVEGETNPPLSNPPPPPLTPLPLRVFEVKKQPHPDDKHNFDYWYEKQKEAFPPKRTFRMFDEYVLYGYPKSLGERLGMGEDGFFRDCVFYVNKLTDQAQWWIPDEWDEQDRIDYILREQVSDELEMR